MPYQGLSLVRCSRRFAFGVLVLGLLAARHSSALAQVDWQFARSSAVGGIAVNAEGVLSNASVDDTGRLARLMKKTLHPAPSDLAQPTHMRMVSLRRLEEAIATSIEKGEPLADEMRYLAGLQEITHVFVDRESRDIILAGPAEGWRVDAKGAVVGVETGRPVMLLDDLLVALRTARPAMTEVISCSIDPTPEGLNRLREYTEGLGVVANRRKAMASFKELLGPQKITVTVVPDTSHFARVMIAADYRMKRLGMNLDRSPVKGLTSYLQMLKASGAGVNDMFPRWWLEPRYESVMRSPDGLAWELHGASVKTMTEADFFDAAGQREQSVEANPVAKAWADNFTEKYDELAMVDPVFGQLRNCMQLAIVAALIVKEDLAGKAGYSLPTLLDPTDVEIEKLPAPKQVDSVVSSLKVNRNDWLVSTSGGVSINSYAALRQVKDNASLAAVREKATGKESATWWWN
ncbi:MAG: DUF1598 domain-containing protein [Pirellulaceae bacterium]|nr:DUF1598 domain-containing protein [Pirellulaceae bacterium]